LPIETGPSETGPPETAPAEPPLPALKVASLSYSFGARRVLQDVAFNVQPGDFTILLGLNGAGKTTLFALITRLYSARQGSIAVFGHNVERHPREALARLGVVFQQPTLDLDLTVEQNLFYHAALHGLSPARARPLIEAELDRIGLLDRRHDRVRALSGGQKRRVELARALVHQPSLLLLDEPTVGLDIESRQYLLQHVRGLCRNRGIGVLWATHLIDEAGEDARVIVLHQGRILADDNALALAAPHGTLKHAFDALTAKAAA
jgi:ABC-2 type transport system ATP-binding protein